MKKIINYLVIVVSCLIVGCGSGNHEFEMEVLEGSDATVSMNQSDSTKVSNNEENNESTETGSVVEITVFICGAVTKPGVYTFDEGMRISDALEKAQGYTSEAHTTYTNLAQLLIDGDKIYIPTKEEVETGMVTVGIHSSEEGTGKVNINTAGKEELVSLSGVGDAKADSIISYRTDYGNFQCIEDILNVSGIGDGVFNSIKDLITI